MVDETSAPPPTQQAIPGLPASLQPSPSDLNGAPLTQEAMAMLPGNQPTAPVAPEAPSASVINMVNPDTGGIDEVPAHQMQMAVEQGFKPASDEQIAAYDRHLKFRTAKETAKAVGEAAGRGLAGPLFTAAEVAAGVPKENILARKEENPILAPITEGAALIAPLVLTAGASGPAQAGVRGAARFTQAGVLSALGSAAVKKIGIPAAATVGRAAAQGAVESFVYMTGDEATKMILNDPKQTLGSAVANVGLGTVLGGGLAGAVGGAGKLWKAKSGMKLAQELENFKGRANWHIENPDPVAKMTDDLSAYYTGIKNSADEVYGAAGLKAQDIAKAMPEMGEAITGQTNSIAETMQSEIKKMVKAGEGQYPSRLVSKLQTDLETFMGKVTEPGAGAAEAFNAAQDLKQTLQGYSKFDKFVKPVDEAYDFVKTSKDLAYQLRTALEDKAVWGKAAERQTAINNAFKDYLPTLKDFERKFTTQVEGVPQIDPGKVAGFINAQGKATAKIRQEMLGNFIEASEKYKKVIGDTHANLGIDNPIAPVPMDMIKSTLGELSPGAKLADYMFKTGLSHLGGEALGATVGGAVGHTMGAPGMGALIGEHALGPFFKSTLQTLVKPLLSMETKSSAFKTAADYTATVVKGEALIARASKNLFKLDGDAPIVPPSAVPSEKDRSHLDKLLQKMQNNPGALIEKQSQGNLNHYMDQHAAAMGDTSARAVQYLNSVRPVNAKAGPLDTSPPLSPNQKASWNRVLDIAQQPLMAVKYLAEGKLTPQDVKTISTLYPELHQKISSQLVQNATEHIAKGNTVPYSLKLQMAMFTGQPMDMTMTPAGIMGAQPQPKAPPQPPQGNAPKPHPDKVGKMASGYQTPEQAAEARRHKPE